MTATKTALIETAMTLAIGAAGAGLFFVIGFPAAVLTGPAAAVSIATLLGLPCAIHPYLRDLIFLVLGISIGSTVTPEVIATALRWPLSLAVLTMALLVILFTSTRVLTKAFGYTPMTALLAAAPGHMSYVFGLALSLNADASRVALVQSVRVLMLTLLVPVLIAAWGVEGTTYLPDVGSVSVLALLVIFPLGLAVGLLFLRAKVPAALLLGGILVSAIGHGADLTPGALPPWMTIAAFVGMGSLIGTRFRGLDRSGLLQAFVAGVLVTLIACVIAALGAVVASGIVGLPPAALLLAFAPGGVEVMAAIAIETGLEPAFVAAHHVFRLLVLTLLLPVLMARVNRA